MNPQNGQTAGQQLRMIFAEEQADLDRAKDERRAVVQRPEKKRTATQPTLRPLPED
jgi:hypothetical protein